MMAIEFLFQENKIFFGLILFFRILFHTVPKPIANIRYISLSTSFLGVKFVPVNTAWHSIIPALNPGRFDIIISGMSVTEERKLRVDFADSYMTVGQTILINKKHKGIVT